jgi:hypothetical protein
MRFAEFKQKMVENGVDENELGDLVHHVLSEQASDINNEGYNDQLTFLLQRYGQENLAKHFGVDLS